MTQERRAGHSERSAADVLRLVPRETAPMVGSGVIIGLVAALGLTRLVRAMLYEVQPNDPATFAAVAITLAVVAMVRRSCPRGARAGSTP